MQTRDGIQPYTVVRTRKIMLTAYKGRDGVQSSHFGRAFMDDPQSYSCSTFNRCQKMLHKCQETHKINSNFTSNQFPKQQSTAVQYLDEDQVNHQVYTPTHPETAYLTTYVAYIIIYLNTQSHTH